MSEYVGQVTHHTKQRGKVHGCAWCGQKIEVGEQYAKWLYFDAGSRDTVYVHEECDEAGAIAAAEEPGGILYFSGDCDRPPKNTTTP